MYSVIILRVIHQMFGDHYAVILQQQLSTITVKMVDDIYCDTVTHNICIYTLSV